MAVHAFAREPPGVRPLFPSPCERGRPMRAASLLNVPEESLTMADVVVERARSVRAARPRKRASLKNALRRKSTMAFFLTLPLILLIALFVLYPAFYSMHLATLNKSMQKFVGLSNFTFLFKRD